MGEAASLALTLLGAGTVSAGLVSAGLASAVLSPLATLNALSRLERVKVETNLAYGDGARHGMDVFTPRDGKDRRPVVVFFYGGGWEEGERASYRFVGAALASRGIVTFIPDYRVYPQVRFPGFLEDGAGAVRWARTNAGRFGGSPARLVLAGHSAGAHIAAMLAFDPQWLAREGLDARRDIAGFAGLAGPYDFLPLRSATLMDIFGPEAQRAGTQPINVVSGDRCPAFLATGARDTTVEPGNTDRLARRIRASGGDATTRRYARADHRTLLGALARPLRFIAPVLDDVTGFVERVTTRENRQWP
ncbi:Acetyl esterase/lipase [Pseudoxanthobacter soli DSM 19599]|uniref:Acetyl esterase/lipase n=1 Tax=Pseudoxanthobacter soli DSM 19599 TaxID=1123029 RepID=A0A1M7ZQ48_9HYPH|nr:alpha/beta hydrolase [Pseudoxanthobacter soli]SHO66776.1 Acetyl esterase/lipase [Pseudoxanthobacter soli DSM 19599]